MTTDLGALLRQWRHACRMSMHATAQQAGVTRVTLHRWETGQFRPRLPELEALLRVLEVTPEQRRQALAVLDAPRAVVSLRQETAPRLRTGCVSPTLAGSLLRVLRQRRGITLEAAARRLGIHKSTLSRWEQGESWPGAEQLHTLCYVLQATLEEFAVLAGGPAGADLPRQSATVETLSDELHRVCMLAPHEPEEALKDLLFLRLEAAARSLGDHAESCGLMADVNAAYASYLAGKERFREAQGRAERALENLPARRDGIWWMYAALALARCATFRTKLPTPKAGLDRLQAFLPDRDRPELAAWALRDMAEYALLAGESQQALRLSAQSCRLVESKGLKNEIFVRQCDHAALLLAASQPRQALEAVPRAVESEPGNNTRVSGTAEYPIHWYPVHRVRMALHCVQALKALQEKQAAQGWLQRAYGVLDTGDLNPHLQTRFRSRADRLARQF